MHLMSNEVNVNFIILNAYSLEPDIYLVKIYYKYSEIESINSIELNS